MIVYRIEDDYGNGPYRTDNFIMNLFWNTPTGRDHRVCKTRPVPRDLVNRLQSKSAFTFDIVCGFNTLAKLNKWFKKYFVILASAGYNIATYEVDKEYCLYDKYQAIFDITKSKLIKREKINFEAKLSSLQLINQLLEMK